MSANTSSAQNPLGTPPPGWRPLSPRPQPTVQKHEPDHGTSYTIKMTEGIPIMHWSPRILARYPDIPQGSPQSAKQNLVCVALLYFQRRRLHENEKCPNKEPLDIDAYTKEVFAPLQEGIAKQIEHQDNQLKPTAVTTVYSYIGREVTVNYRDGRIWEGVLLVDGEWNGTLDIRLIKEGQGTQAVLIETSELENGGCIVALKKGSVSPLALQF